METTKFGLPEHEATPGSDESRSCVPRPVVAGVWAGRVLLVVTITAVITSWLTHPVWAADGLDGKGFPRNWLPNATLALVVASAIFGQWLCGLAASPQASWREGDFLMAETVIGRRRVRIPGAVVVPFRVLGRSGTTFGAFVVDRRLRPLVLAGPFSVGRRSRINRLLAHRAPDGFLRAACEYGVGLLWALATVIAVFIALGVVGVLIGVLRV